MPNRVHEMSEVPLDQAIHGVQSGAEGAGGSGTGGGVARPATVRRQALQPSAENQLEDQTEPKNRDDPDDRAIDADGQVKSSIAVCDSKDATRTSSDARDQHAAD